MQFLQNHSFFDLLGPITIAYFFIVYSFAYFRTNHTIITKRTPVNSVAFTLFGIGSTLGAMNALHAAWLLKTFEGSFVAGLGYSVLACWGFGTVAVNEIVKRKIKHDFNMHSAWQDVIDFTPLPTSLYDKHGKPIIWNKALVEITGYTHKEVVQYWHDHGEIITLLYDKKERKRVEECLKNLGEGYQDKPFTLTRKDGSKKTILWTTKPYHDGTIRQGIVEESMLES